MTKRNPYLIQLSATRRGVLDPVDRFFELLFGLIMVLTFTGTISVAEAGETTVRNLLVASLGCNLAWGIVDAFMFVIGRAMERARTQALGRAIRSEKDSAKARLYIQEALSDTVNHLMTEKDLDHLIEKVWHYPPPRGMKWVTRDDLIGALGVLGLVFFSTFPVVLPFLFIPEVRPAMRVSNGIALLMMFLLGASLARFSNQKTHFLGLAVVGIGLVLVLLTILLGG